MTKSQGSRSRFYSAVEQTADAVFMTDSNGIIQYVNPAFENMTGFTRKEALGKTPSIIKSGVHTKEFYQKLWGTILSGNTFRSTVINKKKNGDLLYTDHSITPLKDSHGKIVSFVGIWKDITEKVLMENRKDEFISIASHELKTPVTNIKLLAELIDRKFKDKPEVNEYAQKMNKQVDKLVRLINDLLNVSRIQAQKLELKKDHFSLQKFINEAIKNIKTLHPDYEVTSKNLQDYDVYADEQRLEEVINNLLENAAKYSQPGSKIIVRAEQNQTHMIVSVQDFGKGIPKEYQDKVFNRFFQLQPHTVQINSGLGLGLYISNEIIKLHGGKMWVDSYPGKGSTFYFTLPI